LTLNADKFLPAVNGQRLTPLNFKKLLKVKRLLPLNLDLTMPNYANNRFVALTGNWLTGIDEIVKLAHRYTEFAAGATLILQRLFV
jgi:hypothetical protein